MTDLDEAKAILAARVAEMNAKWNGRDGLPKAYMNLKGGGRAVYEVWAIHGIKLEGRSQMLMDAPVEAARAWVETTRVLDERVGVLYWRRAVIIEYGETREQFRSSPDGEWGPFETTLKGWKVNGRLVIADGEPDLTLPEGEDPTRWAEMVAAYKAGLPPT